MHGHYTYQPLRRRGLTLVELMVGIVLASVIGLTAAGLFRAGIKSYNYSYRQTRVIYSARKALTGDGPRAGLAWALHDASAVDTLEQSRLSVYPAGGFSTVYFSENGNLYTSKLATRTMQAESVSSMTVRYFNLDQSGRIMASTAAAAASFVTTQVSMRGSNPGDKAYNFLSASELHNKP